MKIWRQGPFLKGKTPAHHSVGLSVRGRTALRQDASVVGPLHGHVRGAVRILEHVGRVITAAHGEVTLLLPFRGRGVAHVSIECGGPLGLRWETNLLIEKASRFGQDWHGLSGWRIPGVDVTTVCRGQ